MLPRETSVRQLQKLRAETKGKDIGDLTANDRLNKNLPNLQYIGNPVDTGEIESWEEFSKKDSQLQTIAFKSKLVNKPLVKGEKTNEIWGTFSTQKLLMNKDEDNDYVDNKDEQCRKCNGHYRKTQMTKVNGKVTCDKCGDQIGRHDEIDKKTNENMKDKVNNLLKFDDFEKNWKEEDVKPTKRTEVAKDVIKEDFYNTDELDTDVEDFGDDGRIVKYQEPDWEDRDIEPSYYEEYQDIELDEDERDRIIEVIYDETNYDAEDLEGLSDQELINLYNELELEDDDEVQDEFESATVSYKEKGSDVVRFSSGETEEEAISKAHKKTGNKVDMKSIKKRDSKNPVAENKDIVGESVKTFETFSVTVAKKEEKQPEYTMLGKEKETKSNPNFGIGAVKDQEIKKISFLNNFTIDPPTPKERPILNAGQFIHTEKVRGYVNRVEGTKVFVESLDEPMKIVEISLKDAVKKPVEAKEEIKKFNEIVEELNKEFLKK